MTGGGGDSSLGCQGISLRFSYESCDTMSEATDVEKGTERKQNVKRKKIFATLHKYR